MRAAILALLLGAPEPQAPPPELLGRWESVARTEGGIGNLIEFREDGSVTQVSAAMGDATYDVTGDWLRTFWRNPVTDKVTEIDAQIDFEGPDLMVETDEKGALLSRLHRMGPRVSETAPWLGQWCHIYMELRPAYREFTSDRMFFRLPVVFLRGTFEAGDGALTVRIPGRPPGRYPYRLEQGRLILISQDGSERIYRRAETSLLSGE